MSPRRSSLLSSSLWDRRLRGTHLGVRDPLMYGSGLTQLFNADLARSNGVRTFGNDERVPMRNRRLREKGETFKAWSLVI